MFPNRLEFCKRCGVFHNAEEKPLSLTSEIRIQSQFYQLVLDLPGITKLSRPLMYSIKIVLLSLLCYFYILVFLNSNMVFEI